MSIKNINVNTTHLQGEFMASKDLLDRANVDTTKWILWWRKHFDHDPRYIADVGANVGLYTYCFAIKLPDANIVAFEPVESTYLFLVENTKKFSSVDAIKVALWSSSTNLIMGMPMQRKNRRDKMNTGLYTACVSHDDMYDSIDVNAVALDEFVVSYHIKGFDIIKFDIEGAELEALRGASNTLDDTKCVIVERNPRTRLKEFQSYDDTAEYLTCKNFTLVHRDFDDVWMSLKHMKHP